MSRVGQVKILSSLVLLAESLFLFTEDPGYKVDSKFSIDTTMAIGIEPHQT